MTSISLPQSWKWLKIGDVCRVIPGYAFKSSDWCDDGIPVIKIKNIQSDCTVNAAEVDHVPRSILSSKLGKFLLRDGDMLIAMTGATAGKVGVLRTKREMLLNQRVARFDVFEANARFFWAVISSQEYQRNFFLLADGAAQPNMSGTQIEGVLIPFPPRAVQDAIGSIVAAYDDLIEINTRRVAILEEMARRIFEFTLAQPAAEDGVLRSTPIRSLVQMTLGGDWGAETAVGNEVNNVRVIRGTDFRRIIAGDFSTSPSRFVSDASLDRRRLREFDLVVENSINAKSRAAGMPLLLTPGVLRALGENAIATSFCRQFRCKDRAEAVVLFHYLHWLRQRGQVEEFQVVAANGIANFQTEQFMARAQIPLDQTEIKRLGEVLLRFDPTVLRQQISILRAQRDLLLPKLISGEIDLSTASASLQEAAE